MGCAGSKQVVPAPGPPAAPQGSVGTSSPSTATGPLVPSSTSTISTSSSISPSSPPPSLPISPRAQGEKTDLFLSYAWGRPVVDEAGHITYPLKEKALKIYRALVLRGYTVWLDDHHMAEAAAEGGVKDAMASSIRQSSAVVCCISAEYAASINCKLECEYANLRRKPVFWVNVGTPPKGSSQQGYDPSSFDGDDEEKERLYGWLQVHILSSMWADCRDDARRLGMGGLKVLLRHLEKVRDRVPMSGVRDEAGLEAEAAADAAALVAGAGGLHSPGGGRGGGFSTSVRPVAGDSTFIDSRHLLKWANVTMVVNNSEGGDDGMGVVVDGSFARVSKARYFGQRVMVKELCPHVLIPLAQGLPVKDTATLLTEPGPLHQLLASFLRRAEVLRNLQHAHLVSVYKIILDVEGGLGVTPMPRSPVALVCDQMRADAGEFLAMMEGGSSPSLPLRLRLASQCAQALDFLHSENVVHGDVKLVNVMVDSEGRAKLGDAGLYMLRSMLSEAQGGNRGTLEYMAPELFGHSHHHHSLSQSRLHLELPPSTDGVAAATGGASAAATLPAGGHLPSPTRASDVYSLGILLWVLFTPKPWRASVYPGKDNIRVADEVREGACTPSLATLLPDTPPELIVLMKACWALSKKSRPTAQEITNTLAVLERSDPDKLSLGDDWAPLWPIGVSGGSGWSALGLASTGGFATSSSAGGSSSGSGSGASGVGGGSPGTPLSGSRGEGEGEGGTPSSSSPSPSASTSTPGGTSSSAAANNTPKSPQSTANPRLGSTLGRNPDMEGTMNGGGGGGGGGNGRGGVSKGKKGLNELFAPGPDASGFVMPRNCGVADFGLPIKGSLKAWRASNPHALTANIENRKDLCDADFVHLAGIKGLRMNNCNVEDAVSDAAFAHLGGLHTLHMDRCSQHSITDAAFVHLAGLVELSMWHCDQNTITSAAFAPLAPSLQVLNMGLCHQEEIGDEAFVGLKALRVLSIKECTQATITDALFKHTPALISLDISRCPQFTDAAFAHFKKLLKLSMQECTQVSAALLCACGFFLHPPPLFFSIRIYAHPLTPQFRPPPPSPLSSLLDLYHRGCL